MSQITSRRNGAMSNSPVAVVVTLIDGKEAEESVVMSVGRAVCGDAADTEKRLDGWRVIFIFTSRPKISESSTVECFARFFLVDLDHVSQAISVTRNGSASLTFDQVENDSQYHDSNQNWITEQCSKSIETSHRRILVEHHPCGACCVSTLRLSHHSWTSLFVSFFKWKIFELVAPIFVNHNI